MFPWVWPGDVLVIERKKASELKPGEIVFYERAGRLFAHRLLRVETRDDWLHVPGTVLEPRETHLVWLAKGDALKHSDPPLKEGEVLGRVVWIERGSKRFRPTTPTRRFVALLASQLPGGPRLLLWLGRASVRLARMVQEGFAFIEARLEESQFLASGLQPVPRRSSSPRNDRHKKAALPANTGLAPAKASYRLPQPSSRAYARRPVSRTLAGIPTQGRGSHTPRTHRTIQ
jgi:hypothetical protein